MNKDVKIETKDLLLRYLKEEDQEAIFNNITHDKDVLKYFVTNYKEKLEEAPLTRQIENFVKNEMYILAIVLKESNETIGYILQCNKAIPQLNTVEIGYAIGKKYWNKGYTTQALKEFIQLLFNEGVHKVTACHILENIASKRVIEKCNMIYEGIRKDDIYHRDRYWDTAYYYLINSNN